MGFSLGKVFKSAAPAFGAAFGTALGGPAGGLIGGALGSAVAGGQDDEMSAMDIYRMQRADALSDWNRQNAYNNPKAQVARLIDAKLNPYLIYSGSNAVGNSTSNIDSVSYPSGVTSAQPLSKSLTTALQNLNLRSMRADTTSKEIDSESKELDLLIKKARLAKLMSPKTSPSKIVDPVKVQYDDTMRNNRVENSIRGSYQNGFLGRLPFIGGYFADLAYRNDLKVRRGIAEKRGVQPWQVDYKSIFSSDY